MKRFFATIISILCFGGTLVHAQRIFIDVKNENERRQPVIVEGSWHAIKGSEVHLAIDSEILVDDIQINEVNVITSSKDSTVFVTLADAESYLSNSDILSDRYTIAVKGQYSYDPDPSDDYLDSQTHDFDVIADYALQFYDVPSFSATMTTMDSIAWYEYPFLELDEDPIISYSSPIELANGREVVWSGAQPMFSYEYKGGYEQGWDVQLLLNNSLINDPTDSFYKESIHLIAETDFKDYTMNISARLTAPDGETDWTPEDIDYTREYRVWSVPSLKSGDSWEFFSNTIYEGKNLVLKPIIAGGDKDAFTYTWTNWSGDVLSNDPSIVVNDVVELEDDVYDFNSYNISVENNPKDIFQGYIQSDYYDVTVCKTPVLTALTDTIGFSGDRFNIGFMMSGYYEYSDSIFCDLKLQNGQVQPINDWMNPNIMFLPSLESGTETVTAIFTQDLLSPTDSRFNQDLHEFTESVDFHLHISSNPVVEISGPEYAILGSEITMTADERGSDENFIPNGSWERVWSHNYEADRTIKFVVNSRKPEKDSSVPVQYSVSSTYTLPQTDKSRTAEDVFIVNVVNAPNHSVLQDTLYSCVGRQINLNDLFEYHDGYKDGWTKKYLTPNGTEIEVPSNGFIQFQESTVNDGTLSYKIHLINTYENDSWYDETFSIPVVVYDKPSATQTQSTTEYHCVSQNINLNKFFEFSGGYPEGWETSYITPSGIEYAIPSDGIIQLEEDTDEGRSPYRIRLTNKYGNEDWYEETFSIPVVVYGEPLANSSSTKEYSCVGRTINLYDFIEYEGGYPTGWTITRYYTPSGEMKNVAKDGVITLTESTNSNNSYKVLIKNEYNGVPWYISDAPMPISVVVYDEPSAIPSQTLAYSCVEKSINLYDYVDFSGGYPGGWKIDKCITPRGAIITVPSDGIVTLTESASNEGNSSYKIQCRNYFENEAWYDKSVTIPVVVYKKPIVDGNIFHSQSAEINRYYGDGDESLTLSYDGGYPDGWTFYWDNGDTSYSRLVENHTPQVDDYESISENYNVTVKNIAPNGEELDSKTYNIIYNKYSKGNLDDIDFIRNGKTLDYQMGDFIKMYGGEKSVYNDIILHSNFKGGYDTGWNFDWSIIEGEQFVLNTENDEGNYKISVNNQTENNQTVRAKLHASNSIDGSHKGNDFDYEILIDVLPSVTAPSSSEWKVDKRDVVQPEFIIPSEKRGNDWIYRWSVYNNGRAVVKDKETKDFKPSFFIDAPNKKIEEFIVQMVWIYRLEDEVLASDTIESSYIVYNTPVKPSRIKLKGSGASNIYIAEMDDTGLSDEQLFSSAYDYALQFGEGNSDTSIAEETTQRWHQYSSSPRTPWVRSCWHYDDFDCCSDMVDIDGNTRAYTGIHEIEAEAGSEPILVLRLNGTLVKVTDSENISELELMPGMYIIKNAITGSSKKILINN